MAALCIRDGALSVRRKGPSETEAEWGVLKTTAIQPGAFLPEQNKRLPAGLIPRPQIEVKAGDILLTCAGPRSRCGIACLVRNTRKKLMISGKMYRFRVPEQLFEPRYLEGFLQTSAAYDAIDRMKTGGNDSGLNLTHDRFRRLEVPVPPLKEQRRIVETFEELISDLNAAVTALERVREKLDVYRASVLKAAAQGALTAEWRKQNPCVEPASDLLGRILTERRRLWEQEQLRKFKEKGQQPPKGWKTKYKEPAAPNTTDLPALPEKWCWTTVEQISTKVVDGVHKKPNYVSSGIPFVTVKNLTAGPGISFQNLNYVTPEDHAQFIKRADPQRGDILVSKDGTLGVIRVIETDVEFSIFVTVALVKPVMLEMSNFLGVALSSPQVQAQMVPKGSGLVHIHLEDLREDCLPLAPMAEQEVIVEMVEDQASVIDHLEADLEAKLYNAQGLRKAILRHAFTGKLVLQDPSGEPASELLKRIAAEREQRAQEAAAAKRLDGRKPRQASKIRTRSKTKHRATKATDNGRIADR
jgi:type I restriction enzyme, S subunit